MRSKKTKLLSWLGLNRRTCRRWLQTVGEDRYTPKIDI